MARKRSRAAGDERAAAGDEQAGDERAAAGDEWAAAGDEQAGDEREVGRRLHAQIPERSAEQVEFEQEFEFMTGRPWPRNLAVAPAAAPAASPAAHEQAGDEQAAAELYQRLLETPGDVVAQMMSGCLEEVLDTFGIKRPTAGNEQEANAMRAELEKLDMPTVCGVLENKTGYRYLGGTYGTTTTAQSERYSGFMRDWHLQHEDGWRAFHGTSAGQAEVVCKDQIPVSRGPLGEGGYVHLHLVDALFDSPCDDKGVVTVVYGFTQTSDIIDGMPNLRVSELWGKNNNGMPIMTTDDITATTFCLKAPDLQFKPCGTMRFAVCREPADDVQTSYFHFSTWKRIVQQFPAWSARQSAARQARFAQIRTLHKPQ